MNPMQAPNVGPGGKDFGGRLRRVCGNCMDYSHTKGICLIRNVRRGSKPIAPMSRKPGQGGCQVHLYAPDLT